MLSITCRKIWLRLAAASSVFTKLHHAKIAKRYLGSLWLLRIHKQWYMHVSISIAPLCWKWRHIRLGLAAVSGVSDTKSPYKTRVGSFWLFKSFIHHLEELSLLKECHILLGLAAACHVFDTKSHHTDYEEVQEVYDWLASMYKTSTFKEHMWLMGLR